MREQRPHSSRHLFQTGRHHHGAHIDTYVGAVVDTDGGCHIHQHAASGDCDQRPDADECPLCRHTLRAHGAPAVNV